MNPVRRRPATETLIWITFGVVLLVVVAIGVSSLIRPVSTTPAPSPTGLPVLGSLPEFRLTERSGRAVTKTDLDGRVWVVNFIFTSCPGICPMLSQNMARLERALTALGNETAQLVSITVDPHRDTPEALREYARRYGADDDRWWFLTGEREVLYRLIKEGFQLAVAERSPEEAGDSKELITHSDRFVLVDGRGRIRAYHRVDGPGVLIDVVRDIAMLEDELP